MEGARRVAVLSSLRLPGEAVPPLSDLLSCRHGTGPLLREELWKGFHFLLAVVVLPGLSLSCQNIN